MTSGLLGAATPLASICTLFVVVIAGLPTAELQQQTETLMTVPLTAVNAAAKKYGTPASATLLLVADLSKIEEGIRKLKLGEIVVLDVEGRQGKR